VADSEEVNKIRPLWAATMPGTIHLAKCTCEVAVDRDHPQGCLRQQWDEEIRGTGRLHAELRNRGYRGSLRTLRRLTARLRQDTAVETICRKNSARCRSKEPRSGIRSSDEWKQVEESCRLSQPA
jgi:hypothetical protein